MKTMLITTLKAELSRIDYPRTTGLFLFRVARYFGRGFAGSIFALLLALHIGLALEMPWAVEVDARLILDEVYRLNFDALRTLGHIGSQVGILLALIFSGFALNDSITYRKIAD